MALPVLSTSSPSSSPEIPVSPDRQRAKYQARCEIDLSPGTRTEPASGPARRAVKGDEAALLKATSGSKARPPSTRGHGRHHGHGGVQGFRPAPSALLTGPLQLAK